MQPYIEASFQQKVVILANIGAFCRQEVVMLANMGAS